MKSLVKATCLVATAIIFSAVQARADVVLGWEASGRDTAQANFLATTVNLNLQTTAGLNQLSRTGLTASTAGNSYASTAWNLSTFDQSNFYVSFTLTPTAGQVMTLTDLTYVINASNTAPGTGQWGYSIGGGAFVFQPSFSISFTAASANWDFTDFNTTQSVEFRFWAYGATSVTGGTSSSTGSVRVPGNITGDDLVLNGSFAPVPEPSTIALLAFGMIGMLAFARRRHA